MDPFEVTQRESGSQPAQQSVSPSRSSSLVSTIAGTTLSGAAIWQIGQAWSDGRIPTAWHAVLAIVLCTLPTDGLTSLARGAIRAWANRSGGK